MYCDECIEPTNDYVTIVDNNYCRDCAYKYMLSKCPGELCYNVISLNGYDIEDVENNTCTSCDTIFCGDCLVKARNLRLCKYCFEY